MELGIWLSFVKTSEFGGGGCVSNPPKHLPVQYATAVVNVMVVAATILCVTVCEWVECECTWFSYQEL
jgi:hypothetical protein